jgi:hypothetical protein
MAEHIRLTGAGGTRARPPQGFEVQEGLDAVIPGNGQLLTDGLDIRGKKALSHDGFRR